jgi:hypothetical protein
MKLINNEYSGRQQAASVCEKKLRKFLEKG